MVRWNMRKSDNGIWQHLHEYSVLDQISWTFWTVDGGPRSSYPKYLWRIFRCTPAKEHQWSAPFPPEKRDKQPLQHLRSVWTLASLSARINFHRQQPTLHRAPVILLADSVKKKNWHYERRTSFRVSRNQLPNLHIINKVSLRSVIFEL